MLTTRLTISAAQQAVWKLLEAKALLDQAFGTGEERQWFSTAITEVIDEVSEQLAAAPDLVHEHQVVSNPTLYTT